MNTHQLVSMVKELDNLMPVPEHPEDENAPIRFGNAGFIVMGDNGTPMVLNSYDNPRQMMEDRSIAPFAGGYGHLFLVSYGAVLSEIDEDDDPDNAEIVPVRLIIGLSSEGIATTLFRNLATDEVTFCDEDCTKTDFDTYSELFG
jgi:hypothetical protein